MISLGNRWRLNGDLRGTMLSSKTPRWNALPINATIPYDRWLVLAALNLGMTRPLLAVAIALRNDPAAGARLCMAFPQRRNILDRLASLADDLPFPGAGSGENHVGRSQRQHTDFAATPQPEYLTAAREAINQLGATVDRGELLRRAESILETSRQHAVDIQ